MSKLLAITWIVVLSHVCILGIVSKQSSTLKSNINQYLANNSSIK